LHSDEQALIASQTLILPWIVAIVEKRAGGDGSALRDVDVSICRNHPFSWFQLTKMRLTI
jgi:hypothetical protein